MFQAMTISVDKQVARCFGAVPFLLILAPLMLTTGAMAQYPGRIKPDAAKKPDEPRAVSILEWVGAPGKPVASRIVPLSVFIHGGYQDGGLYLAQPAPITVENDTLYELQQAGVPKGTFYVAGGQEVGGAWFGYGKWKPLGPPPPIHKLAPAKDLPKVVEDHDPDRPHLKGSGGSPTSGGSASSTAGGSTAPSPADDPDKPTLHRSPSAGGTGQSTTSGGGSGSGSGSGSASGTTTSSNDPDGPTLHRRSDSDGNSTGAGSAPEDPDRPHLRKRSAAEVADADDSGAPVTSVNEGDPDRPKLSHGKPAPVQAPLEATKLTGVPANLQQMTAISDPVNREEHTFSYPWPDPAQAATMQAAVEQLAIKAVMTGGISPADRIGPVPAGTKPVKNTTAKSTTAHKTVPQSPTVVLSDKDFHAYELSYNGGATLVFTAKATVGPDKSGATQEKYVTIIAQPDFNGDPQPRLQSVTDAQHLDITPRMKFVDAVDTDGDNRAELIFELMRSSDRQFAIYKIKGLQAEQAFATESLPYVSPGHSVETSSN